MNFFHAALRKRALITATTRIDPTQKLEIKNSFQINSRGNAKKQMLEVPAVGRCEATLCIFSVMLGGKQRGRVSKKSKSNSLLLHDR